MKSDLIVVGGGLAGLACAVLAARDGLSVTLLERASHVGGRAISPHVGGIAMNLGAHALYLGGPGEALLGELGIPMPGFKPSASDAWLSDERGAFASPTSLLSLLTTKHFSFGERMGLVGFFAKLDAIRPTSLRGRSTTTWLDELGHTPRARRFLDAMVRVSTYSNAPDALPASIAVRQLQIAIGLRAKGVMYIDDGWQSLVDALERCAREANVRIITSANVVELDAPTLTLDDNDTHSADHIILALPHANAHALINTRTSSSSVHAACLDVILDAPVSRRLVFALDQPHYFSVHAHPSSSPPLRAHAFRYLAPGESGADHKQSLVAWVERVVPDFRAHVASERFLPEMVVASALASESRDVPEIEGVSFAGDWLSREHVLFDAVAESVSAAFARVRRRARAA